MAEQWRISVAIPRRLEARIYDNGTVSFEWMCEQRHTHRAGGSRLQLYLYIWR